MRAATSEEYTGDSTRTPRQPPTRTDGVGRYGNRWESGECGGCENWMRSKACGQVVSRARAISLAASRVTLRGPVRPVVASRYCLFFPISSRFYRTVGAPSVSLSWLHRDVGEVVRTQKYQTALVPFCNGVFIEKRVATRDTCARCKRVFGDARRCGFAPQKRLLFIAALSFCNSRLRLIF